MVLLSAVLDASIFLVMGKQLETIGRQLEMIENQFGKQLERDRRAIGKQREYYWKTIENFWQFFGAVFGKL